MRSWALTKLGQGDWLCPSNDQQLLYRFDTYEDGAALGLDVGYRLRTFWRVRSTPMPAGGLLLADDADELRWLDVHYGLRTRREALASVYGPEA